MENQSKGYRLKWYQKVYRAIKAGMDFLVAFLAIILLLPLFAVVAIAIKIDSKGPVFFVQKRIGKNGKPFSCIKFRSMSQEANHELATYDMVDADVHITKVGRFIRKWSIDELPQLFCLLNFKMSLIGYRPVILSELELNTAREEYEVYQVRPGLSGWAQVNGRDVLAANPPKKAEFDAYYLRRFSLWLDIKIFFLTFIKVFRHDGVSEGVVEESQEGKEVVLDEVAVAYDDVKEQTLDVELQEAQMQQEKENEKIEE